MAKKKKPAATPAAAPAEISAATLFTPLVILKSATDLHQVASILDMTPSGLAYILYKKHPSLKYTKFNIPKKYGGTRPISAPSDDLKLLQRKLGNLLQDCVAEINKVAEYKAAISHGFVRHRSILTNARVHRNRRWVFNLDLENFFGCINFGRVRGFFLKDRNFALHEDVATVLAQIACFENALPQGSPCSPVISNLVGHILDIHLVRLAASAGCSYTRYADDLTFSTNNLEFPTEIAQRDTTKPNTWNPGPKLVHLIKKSGFQINEKKVRMQYRDSRQEVTGLVVNRKVNVRREYRHTARAMVHNLLKTGSFAYVREVKDAKGVVIKTSTPGTPAELHGMLGFIDGVDLYNWRAANEQITPDKRPKKSTLPSEAIYKRFLYFKEFYDPSLPVILCEGKTDNVYLAHAIHKLAAGYPDLATIDKKTGTIKLKVRPFKYTGSSTSRILGITGGASQLKHFIGEYFGYLQGFTAPGKKNPVIVLVDNDDAGKDVLKLASGKFKATPVSTTPAVHVFANLYVVSIPHAASDIEDLFEPAVRKVEIDGKKFDPDAKEDSTTHYGKTVFAHKVVAVNKDKINFDGFIPLLDNFTALIRAHAKKKTP